MHGEGRVLSVTILETTKTFGWVIFMNYLFYRSQFWRLQKQIPWHDLHEQGFIGHNFGDYKNRTSVGSDAISVLSVTILETTKTSNGIS